MSADSRPHSMQRAFAAVRQVLAQGMRAMDELGWTHADVMAQSTLGEIERKYERLEEQYEDLARAARTRPDYDVRCRDCGAPHWFDTSLPSEVWNQIAKPEDLLCLLCIDERLAAAGIECDQAEFYFVGAALKSKMYDESHGDVAYLKEQLEALQRERDGWRQQYQSIADQLITRGS